MTAITEPAPAKINLALHIRAKRPDGYHDLETLFAFARDGDTVTVQPATRDSFEVTGPFSAALQPTPAKAGAQHGDARNRAPAFAGVDGNLAVRAATAFRAAFRQTQPYAITLAKNLPIASGIGGGSADAAATLRALARLYAINPSDPELFAIAARLGADVPACLYGRTALGTGRGDELQPLAPFGDLPLLLVNPRVGLSTAAMFAAWDGIDHGPIAATGSPLERAHQGRNDFTVPAIRHAPVVAQVLDLLSTAAGCSFARLSGSGATCFGLFADTATRDAAAAHAHADGRGWWTLATTLE